MRFWETFRFEVVYQSRRISTWFYFVLLLVISFLMAREVFVNEAQEGGYFLNAPFAVAQVTLVACILSLLPLAAFAGGAAARDVETRMHPLLYTAPVGKAAYLGGRFLAAFALGALIMAAIPAGLLAAALLPGEHADLIGPLRPAAYASAYFLLALPNAFVSMALMFSAAVFGRRGVVSYLGGAFVFFAAVVSWQLVAAVLGHWDLAKLTDPLGLTLIGELSKVWTPGEKNALVVGPQTSVLLNRLAWLGVALGVLALTYLRFRFAHVGGDGRRWGRRRLAAADAATKGEPAPSAREAATARSAPVAVPSIRRTFGLATRVRQTLAVARESFRVIVKGWGGPAVVALALFVILIGPLDFQDEGFPQLPTTGEFVNVLEQAAEHGMWLIVPLLIVYYAGELVWREREARLNEIAGAAPVPVWVSFAGKFAGLALALVATQALLMAAAMLVQARMGYYEFEVGVYVQILFGIRLTDYLLFALLALVVQVVVEQKYVGHLIAIIAYVLVAFGPQLGIEPGLLVYGSDPGWTYSDMRGLEPFIGPWLLFKLYWAAWALLLAILAKLLWPRGTERGLGQRLRLARRRLTRRTAVTAAAAAALVLTFGGLIYYNTSVLYASHAAPSGEEWRAEYERRYGRYAGVPQPRPTATSLRVEIYPKRRAVEIRGTYNLVNMTEATIDSIHVATALEAETRAVSFDRQARPELLDEKLGHRIYVLETPLRPGDSLKLEFEVRFDPRGFPNSDIDASVAPNGTFFGTEWLPRVGYQRGREFRVAGQRRAHGLPPRPEVPPLDDPVALTDVAGLGPIMFEAVVGTDEGQTAVAPGALRRTWAQDGRRYFHYATDAPILNNFAFFSAAYAVREGRWNNVEIQIFHHPEHALNVDRMLRSVQASLDLLTKRLGPYPHRQLRFVEYPGRRRTLYAHPINIRYMEGFSFINPEGDPRGIDLPFATVAHEVAHQWWGNRLVPASVVGAPLLTESLAWYSALEVVEAAHGREQRERLLGAMRASYLSPRARAGSPLLRATDRFQWYRKGVLAMCALREYVGAERVDAALRRFFERHGSATPPLPTTLDLYRELQAVTPEELRYLLADLFEANTYWELAAKRVEAERTGTGEWRVTLDVQARKVVVDEEGVETEVPMDDLVEIGVFAAAGDGGASVPPYLRMHRVRSGEQRITLTVPREPAGAGIDPRHLLIDLEAGDNFAEVTGGAGLRTAAAESSSPSARRVGDM
jgi:ABC-type transport system involved in multi-copper enzyme maturation permease subunit